MSLDSADDPNPGYEEATRREIDARCPAVLVRETEVQGTGVSGKPYPERCAWTLKPVLTRCNPMATVDTP